MCSCLMVVGGLYILYSALQGGDYRQLDGAARDLMEYACSTNLGLEDLESDYEPTSPSLLVDIESARAADLGVPFEVIGCTLEPLIRGRVCRRQSVLFR